MVDQLKHDVRAWGPDLRIARVRFTPAASPALQVLTDAFGVASVTRTAAGAWTGQLVDTKVKDMIVLPLEVENDTTHHHQVRCESFDVAAGTFAITHKASAFANATYTPTGTVYMTIPDCTVDDTYYAVSGVAGAISSIRTVIDDAVADADVVLTCNINGTPITGGVVTIATAGSAAGDRDSATPSAANTVAVGDYIGVVATGGGAADAAQCEMAFVVTGAAATVVTSGVTAPAASDTVDQIEVLILYRVYS